MTIDATDLLRAAQAVQPTVIGVRVLDVDDPQTWSFDRDGGPAAVPFTPGEIQVIRDAVGAVLSPGPKAVPAVFPTPLEADLAEIHADIELLKQASDTGGMGWQ